MKYYIDNGKALYKHDNINWYSYMMTTGWYRVINVERDVNGEMYMYGLKSITEEDAFLHMLNLTSS